MTGGTEDGVPGAMNLDEPADIEAAGNNLILAYLARRSLGLPKSY